MNGGSGRQGSEPVDLAPARGESVVELNGRVREFLDMVMTRATAMIVDTPTLVVLTYGLFMREVYRYRLMTYG